MFVWVIRFVDRRQPRRVLKLDESYYNVFCAIRIIQIWWGDGFPQKKKKKSTEPKESNEFRNLLLS